MREIKSILFKRIHLSSSRGDKSGHWWFEIGEADRSDSESYGWWPSHQVTLKEVFLGVKGELNDGLSSQVPRRDPHHGEAGDEEFHPLVVSDDPRSEADVANCLREFAHQYSGEWRWFLGWGQNCHTFQREACHHCRLQVPAHIRKAKL